MPGTVTPLVLMFTSVILTYVLPSCSWRFGVLDRGHTCVLSDCMRWLYPEDPYGILVRSRKGLIAQGSLLPWRGFGLCYCVMLVRKFYVYGSVSTPFKFQVDPLIL